MIKIGKKRLFGLLRCDILYFESHDGIPNSNCENILIKQILMFLMSYLKQFKDSKIKTVRRVGMEFPLLWSN